MLTFFGINDLIADGFYHSLGVMTFVKGIDKMDDADFIAGHLGCHDIVINDEVNLAQAPIIDHSRIR